MADPISATGLALAIIPLLISAFENYENTFQPFVTYYRHVKEVQRFLTRLGTQKTIFLNECELLFTAVSNGTRLTDVLRDPNHPCRKDEEISTRLQALLGSSYSSCVSLLSLINGTLTKINSETKGFESLLEEKGTRNAKGKSSLFLFRQKVKISFSKTRLNETVDELRRYSEDLVTLSRQIRELTAQGLVQLPSHTSSNKILSHLQVVKKASARLHDILSSKWSCDERIEHMAGMSLNVQDAERCQHKTSKVLFNLVLKCIPQDDTRQPDPLWLKIESAPSEQNGQDITISETPADPPSMLQAKLRSVTFEIQPMPKSSRLSSKQVNALLRDTASFVDPPLDLCAIGRLCRYFQRQQRKPLSGEPCVGFLEKTKTFKHFVYSSPGPRVLTAVTERRLKEILQKDFEDKRQEAWSEKLSLARLLALAVLRFQGTPWLAESWSSKDISLYGANPRLTDDTTPLNAPYLNAKLISTNSLPAVQPAQPDYNASSIAPNPTLFSLGVVLLELGYDAPLEALRREEDLQHGASNQFTDYFTAKRLGKMVSKRLNTRYGKLVERCLTCNFGVGSELDSPDLQTAVVVNVVNELDECLKDFEKFNSLLPSLGYPL